MVDIYRDATPETYWDSYQYRIANQPEPILIPTTYAVPLDPMDPDELDTMAAEEDSMGRLPPTEKELKKQAEELNISVSRDDPNLTAINNYHYISKYMPTQQQRQLDPNNISNIIV